MGLAMTFIRLAPGERAVGDPRHAVRPVFGHDGWQAEHDAEHLIDLGDRWQGLHYMLTGDPWEGERPASDVICGGVLITEDDALRDEVGIDVLYLSVDRVATAAALLAEMPGERLVERLDPGRMAELDLEGDWRGVTADFVRESHERLVKFFGQAAADGQPVFKTMG